MKIYKSYLIKNLFKPLVISLTTLTAIIWASRIIRYMDYVVQDGAEFLSFIKLTMLVLPSLVLTILPLTVFLTTILTYSKLIENSEIVILKNCGIKKIDLLKPLITLSIIIAIVSYSISLYGSYKANMNIREIRSEIQNNMSFSLIKGGVFTKFKNIVIYADEKEENAAHNIVIYERAKKNIEGDKNLLIQAKLAKINRHIITLYDGNFQQFTSELGSESEILFFDEYNIDFNELSDEQMNLTLKVDSLPTIKLIEILKNYDNYKKEYSKNKIIYEINYRFLFPLVSIIMALVSGSLMLYGTFNRTCGSKTIAKTAVISVCVYILLLSLFQKVVDGMVFLYILFAVMIFLVVASLNTIKERSVI